MFSVAFQPPFGIDTTDMGFSSEFQEERGNGNLPMLISKDSYSTLLPYVCVFYWKYHC